MLPKTPNSGRLAVRSNRGVGFLGDVFLRIAVFALIIPSGHAEFSGSYGLTPPEPAQYTINGPLAPALTVGKWRAQASAGSMDVNTLLAPSSLTLSTGLRNRPVGGYFTTRAVGSGTVSFEYTITGQGSGSFSWFKGTNVYFDAGITFIQNDTNLVSNPIAVSFAVQAGEDFGFRIGAAPPGMFGPELAGRTVTITNFSGPEMTFAPQLSINDLLVDEPQTGTTEVTFAITLSSASTQTVTVAYATVDGTAVHGVDYNSVTGTLTFNSGETSKAISIEVLGDAAAEGQETFSVTLTNAVNAAIGKNQGTVTIAELRITGLKFSVQVSFTTVDQARYRVEWREDSAVWSPVIGSTNVLGTGEVITIVDEDVACRPNRIYRVRLLE